MNKKKKIIMLLLCFIIILSDLSFFNCKGDEEEVIIEQKKIITVYSVDNRTLEIKESELLAYEKVGWYKEPVTPMYASDGRVEYMLNSEVELYKTLGWFLTAEEARESILRQEEVILLAKLIHAEAAADNYTDKCYVGAVVMNRLACGKWGNTLKSVISARGQYSSYLNKKFNQYPPEDCIAIAKQLLLGERFGMPANVIFQSGGPQGKGIWKKVYNSAGNSNHYYCYGNI